MADLVTEIQSRMSSKRLAQLSNPDNAAGLGVNTANLTNAAIRTRIGERFGVTLRRDGQLSEFWQWQFRQGAIDHLGEMMSENEELLSDKFPHLTRDQLREITIKQGYAVANLINDPKLGLKVASVDLKDKGTALEQEKWRESVKSKLQAGLDAVAEATCGVKKTANGMEAIQWWREGKQKQVAEYCCYDVKTTRLVHEHGVRTGEVAYVSHKTFLKQQVSVDWASIGPVAHLTGRSAPPS
jgi:hypothetical protein